MDDNDKPISWFVWVILFILFAAIVLIFGIDLPGFRVWNQ